MAYMAVGELWTGRRQAGKAQVDGNQAQVDGWEASFGQMGFRSRHILTLDPHLCPHLSRVNCQHLQHLQYEKRRKTVCVIICGCKCANCDRLSVEGHIWRRVTRLLSKRLSRHDPVLSPKDRLDPSFVSQNPEYFVSQNTEYSFSYSSTGLPSIFNMSSQKCKN